MSNLYFALWFHIKEKETNYEYINTNIISSNHHSLINIFKSINENPFSSFQNYKHLINEISINYIDCYQYNELTLSLESYTVTNKIGAFYASNYHPSINFNNSNLILKEILVFLTKEQHELWRLLSKKKESVKQDKYPTFFYDQCISDNIEPDVYYDEGIINAYNPTN